MKKILILTLPLAVVIAFLFGAEPATLRALQPSQKTTDSGVYTAAQAERGQKAFEATCAACHTTSEYNNNAYRGLWQGRSTFDLVDIIATTMPQDLPGSLPHKQYVDIVGYLLKLNGAPEGRVELPSDTAGLKAIKITWKKS